VAILSPGYPDVPGGVTDHTGRLAASWEASGHQVNVIGGIAHDPTAAAERLAQQRVEALLIQYVPFLYGRRGVSAFPERIAKAAAALGVRVTVFVHEPWVPPTRPAWVVLSPIQRRQLRHLLACSDACVTAVPAWGELLDAQAELVYVGNTLGELPSHVPSEPDLPAPVVFSPFASGLNWPWITEAAAAIGTPPGLMVIGADAPAARAHHVVRRWFTPSWDWAGRLPAENVIRLLARARLVLAPFVDGVSGRRTSVAAALSVGAKTLTSTGPLFDQAFTESPLAIAKTGKQFVQRAAELWNAKDPADDRRVRLDWYRRHLDPQTLDAHLLSIMTAAQ
jgi:glycosyltransferase involved in cell wall biosynthesis